jgi:hypothetical protein
MDTSGTVPTAVDLSDFYKFDLRCCHVGLSHIRDLSRLECHKFQFLYTAISN